MPVYLKRRIKKGWKAKENERYGDCFVIMFCDEKTDKVLFEYAPNLVDEPFFTESFAELKIYDEIHKATLELEKRVSTSQTTKNWNDNCRLKSEQKKG